MGTWWLDVKLGVRMLFKHPGLALVGGFGIAVAVAIAAGGFSVIYGNFLATSLPLEEGDRIVSMEVWDLAANKPARGILHEYQGWRAELKSIQEIGAFRTITPSLIATGGKPESVRVAMMSASGFKVARVRPLMGRYLVEEDEREGAGSVVVIGEEVWLHRFGGDPTILGRTIQLGARPHSIVGVMPAGFAFPVNHRFWVPLKTGLAPEPLTGPDLMVFGRLAPGATRERAQAELDAIGRRTARAFPKIYAQMQPHVLPYAHPFLGLHDANDVTGLHMMNGIITLLLVLVCLNVAILVYTRTVMRQSEIALRTALGASRGRIVTQLFVEALVLSSVAAAAGVGIAALALRYIAGATLPIAQELPFWLTFDLAPMAVLYAGVLSVLAAAIVGVVPALKATKGEVSSNLTTIGAGGSGMRLGKTWTVLIVAQVGFAVALLPAGVFNAWGAIRSGIADVGFAADEFLSAQLGMDGEDGGKGEFTRRFTDRQRELMRRLQAEPRVSGFTFSMAMPGDEPSASIEVSGTAAGSGTTGISVRYNRVDIDYFRTFGVPILAGRGFETADVAEIEGGAVVVNQTFAQKVFGGNALGQRIRYEGKGWHEIVGIVRDFPAGVSPGMDDSVLKVYHAAGAGQVEPVSVAVRLRGGTPASFGVRLREIAADVDPNMHLRNIVGLDEALRREQWIRRMEATTLTSATLSVLLLSCAGIYSLMSFTVSQRRREIGIRMALGADRTRIVTSIFSRVLGQLAVGAALGMAMAAVLEYGWGGQLTRANAAVVFPAVALFMVAVGFLAALGPARRCLGTEPTEALREQ